MSSEQKEEPLRLLAHLNGEKPPAPQWFEDAIAAPAEERSVEVEGATVRYLAWGERGKPGLLLIHGGRAHADWWRPFAPFLAEHFRVAAIHLSGMGDSDHRDAYSLLCHVKEAFAVSEDAGLHDISRPIFVGHSFGGYVTLGAVEQAGERLKGAIIIDSPIIEPDPDEGYHFSNRNRDPQPVRPNRVYPDLKDALARFRFLPNQPCENLYLVDYIARTGLKEVDGGWTWKFDPALGQNFELHFQGDLFLAARCPLAFLYGGKSAFHSEQTFAHLRKQTGGRSPIIIMPETHHHLMMDEPMAFVSTLRSIFATWPVRIGVI